MNNIHHYSRYTDKGPSIAERVIRSMINLLKKLVFEERNASRINEPATVSKNHNNFLNHSTKMTPIEASKKVNEKTVFSNLQDKTNSLKPRIRPGDSVRTSDFIKLSVKSDSAEYS